MLIDSPQQFEAYTQVIPKVEIVEHVNNVVRLIRVLFAQLIENSNLDERLMMEALLVANNFDCHILIGFVIQCPDDLAEATLANHLEYLIAIAYVIVNDLKEVREWGRLFKFERIFWMLGEGVVFRGDVKIFNLILFLINLWQFFEILNLKIFASKVL